jgi:hypothetical protein
MRKITLFLLLGSLLSCSSRGQQPQTQTQARPRPNPVSNVDDEENWQHFRNYNYQLNSSTPGMWRAIVDSTVVYIQFQGFEWNSQRMFLLSELGPLPTDKEGIITLQREPGTLTLKGLFHDHQGQGTYSFRINTEYTSYLSSQGYKVTDDELALHLFLTDMSKDYFAYLHEHGYTAVSQKQLEDLAEQNVSKRLLERYFELFQKEDYGHVSLDKIIELREHGVTASYIYQLQSMGYQKISLDRAQELVDHGVTPRFIESMKALGEKNISLDRAEELVDHGVNEEAVRTFRKAAGQDLPLSKIEELIDHGVNPAFIRNLRELGYPEVSLDKAEELIDHGVSIESIKGFRELGYKDITLAKAEELADHGVNPQYIRKMKEKGYNKFTLDQFEKLRDAGIDD